MPMSSQNQAEVNKIAHLLKNEFERACKATAGAALRDVVEFHTVHDSSNAAFNWHVTLLPGKYPDPTFTYGWPPVGDRGDAGANRGAVVSTVMSRWNWEVSESFEFGRLKNGFAIFNPIDEDTETGSWWELTRGLYFWHYWKPLMAVSQILDEATSAFTPGPNSPFRRTPS